MSKIRELALELLNDDHGITQDAWTVLYHMLEEDSSDNMDIVRAVDGCEGRVYLPENFGG